MPLTAAASAREILTGLHEIMAKRGSAQAKLDRVVDLIAEAMKSEVCSIYLLRDNKLELFATHGLRKEAVHVTRLKLGEGLVGTIADEGRILNLAEASEPPRVRLSPRNRRGALPQLCRRPDHLGARAPSACFRSSMRNRADTTMSRSRRFRRWRWSCRNLIAAARLVDGARRGR
jgi:phosphotransferase system, enzyme I, PtsP